MDRQTPRYKKDVAQEELPKKVEKPNLRVCQLSDSKLVLPRDVRHMFLQDPVWAPEWREMLQKFDEQWGTQAAAQAAPAAPGASTTASQAEGTAVKEEGTEGTQGFDWGSVFPQEPTTLDKIKAKHGNENLIELPALGNTSFLVGPGPCLYLMAKETVILKQWEAPLIMHGAGVWLIGDKARKFATNNPGRGVPCCWTDDLGYVCLEDVKFAKSKVESLHFLTKTNV